jgi:C4-dicarboxylate transporter, DctM subunit
MEWALIFLLIALILFLIGSPIYVAFGVGGIFAVSIWLGLPLSDIGLTAFQSVNKFTLVAVPLFIFSGYLMLHGGASEPLIDFINGMIGHLPGGLAIVMVVSCTFFGALCGSTLATIAAIGTIMVPYMEKNGYSRSFSSGLLSCAGTLGNIIPPSIVMIIYGDMAETSVAALFAAGLVPGLIMAGLLCVVSIFIASRRKYKRASQVGYNERWRLFLHALPALLMPIIVLGGIYGGICTPTEAAAVAVVYSVIIGYVAYKKLTFKILWKSLHDSAVSTAIILVLILTATFLGRIFVYLQLPQQIAALVVDAGLGPFGFLFWSSIALIFLGMLIEGTPLILIGVPILLPSILTLGISPVHWGVIYCLAILVGQFTPPVGIAVFMTCGITGETPENTIREGYPFAISMVVTLLITAIWPGLSLWLPNLMGIFID